MKKSILLICICSAFLAACNKDDIPNGRVVDEVKTKQLFNYFPLIENSEYIYKVDSIDLGKVIYDTITYWIKEEVGAQKLALDNQYYHTIDVYVKNNWEDDWQKIRVDLARKTGDLAERYSENIMYINQVIPYNANVRWDATPYNDISFLHGDAVDFSECRYDTVHSYAFLNNWGFDSTIAVVQFEEYGPVNRYNFRERYANNIGLYYKYQMSANFQDPNPGDVVDTSTFIPKSGYILKQELVEYKLPK